MIYPTTCKYTDRTDGSSVKQIFQHRQTTPILAAMLYSRKATSYAFASTGLSVLQTWTNEESRSCDEETGATLSVVGTWSDILSKYELQATYGGVGTGAMSLVVSYE